jgi:lipoprotein-anchoring transpeptidase ErfK/SrfK
MAVHARTRLAVLAVSAVLVSCGGNGDDHARPAELGLSTTSPSTTTAGTTGITTGDDPVPPSRRRVAQAVGDRIEIFDQPGAARARWTLDNPNPRGGHITFLVEREEPDWVNVDAPVRPNGSSGWVRKDNVVLSWTDYALRLDLSDRKLTVGLRGQQTWSAPVAVGEPATPTPVGEFYLAELVKLPDPGGTYGPYAFGLSAFSEVLEQFNGGEPIIGLHGTNHPDLIGGAVSNGCIRMSNDDVSRLAAQVPLGTPITIVG